MDIEELKKKLREIKRLEKNIRFHNCSKERNIKLVWDKFFSTKDINDYSVKYNLANLLAMDHKSFKEVVNEYFYEVYYQFYKENGLVGEEIFDPRLLSMLGLSAGSSMEDIKKRFRELAKKYHPDCGGDSERFIELIEVYEKLIGK